MLPNYKSYPLIKHFFACSQRDYVDAGKEIFSILLFALLPFWLGYLLSYTLTDPGAATKFLHELTENGEILIVSAALTGPLLYILTKDYDIHSHGSNVRFPFGWFFVVSVVVICMFSAGIFGIRRVITNSQLFEPGNIGKLLDFSKLSVFSYVIFVAAVTMLFLVSLFRNSLERGGPVKLLRNETASYVREFEK